MEEHGAWKRQRAQAVAGSAGWLTVCGLYWLTPPNKDFTFGSDPSNDIQLPAKNTPPFGGTLRVQEDNDTTMLSIHNECRVNIQINGENVTSPCKLLHDLAQGGPTVAQFENSPVSFFLLKRSNKIAVRMKDQQSERISSFKGLECFPYNSQHVFTAKFTPHDKIVCVPNILNDVLEYKSPGSLTFTWVDGNTYTIDPVLESPHSTVFWVIFKDATSGHETYPMRFISTKLPDDQNTVTLDFNYAYNPACAFTEFAACPLAPKQNMLPFRVESGEKKPDGH